jgi:hypothetical protein
MIGHLHSSPNQMDGVSVACRWSGLAYAPLRQRRETTTFRSPVLADTVTDFVNGVPMVSVSSDENWNHGNEGKKKRQGASGGGAVAMPPKRFHGKVPIFGNRCLDLRGSSCTIRDQMASLRE